MTYVVEGVGEFKSLGAALEAAIVKPTVPAPAPSTALVPAPPAVVAPTAPAPSSSGDSTLLWVGIGIGALVAFAIYAAKQSDAEDAAEGDDTDEGDTDEGDTDEGDTDEGEAEETESEQAEAED